MAFPQSDAEKLLAQCHRRCCICHRFCGVKIELDHIVQRAHGGPDTVDNAIAVCFECHAEIHAYNDKHPRGRKLKPSELKLHKEQWLAICKKQPQIFIEAARDTDVGPVQSLVDELEFNVHVSRHYEASSLGCLFQSEQFRRAISCGVISTLESSLKSKILEAYRSTERANQKLGSAFIHAEKTGNASVFLNKAKEAIIQAQLPVQLVP